MIPLLNSPPCRKSNIDPSLCFFRLEETSLFELYVVNVIMKDVEQLARSHYIFSIGPHLAETLSCSLKPEHDIFAFRGNRSSDSTGP
mmetsp:Transcript_19670/g.29118  ORF Transcript_19670/g.29118 Transcript_19670/m.29118 type:complete len:87 (+) Transcript_19670:227-487(+)